MIELYLLRHGEAEMLADSDDQRVLTAKGKQQIIKNRQHLPSLDLMVVSPYERTQQTAGIVSDTVDIVHVHDSDTLIPDSTINQVQNWLETMDAEKTLLVTHNPLVSALAGWLTGEKNIYFDTGSLACLRGEFAGPGCMELVWIKN